MRSIDDILRRLVQGRLRSNQLPSTIDVWDLEEGLADLRRRSLEVPPEQQVEWGGCIIMQENRLQLAHLVSGSKYEVEPKCEPEDVDHHDSYVGFAHIHLPDETTGMPYLGFSELDFRGSLVDGDNMALVCNGPEVFALVRTSDRTQSRCVPTDNEFESWERLYDNLIQQARLKITSDPEARKKGSDALNRALWEANKKMCQNLGFAFYRGLWCQPLKLMFRPQQHGNMEGLNYEQK